MADVKRTTEAAVTLDALTREEERDACVERLDPRAVLAEVRGVTPRVVEATHALDPSQPPYLASPFAHSRRASFRPRRFISEIGVRLGLVAVHRRRYDLDGMIP